jgi:diketogulonate reductase-like aldo/keto reductase
MLYGTAWKEERTQELVVQALNAGFTGIDTANQRKHYFEEGVGLGIQQFLQTSQKKREDLFIQTKFTYATGQDHRKPYNELDSFTHQVKESFLSSLQHLQTEYIDSYVLHGPYYNTGLISADWEVWKAMELLIAQQQVKFIGVSNINISQLKELYEKATVKPAFVQNRCFASSHWDQEIRTFCIDNNIIYQGFSLLTANQNYLFNPIIQTIATKYQKTLPQIIFRFAKNLGMLPLTGTTSLRHMKEDLHIDDFHLTAQELNQIEFINN